MGNDCEGSVKDGSNGAEPFYGVYDGGSVGFPVRKLDMGGYGGRVLKVLKVFHNQVESRMTGMITTRNQS